MDEQQKITIIVTILGTIVATLLGGYLLNTIQLKEPNLQYYYEVPTTYTDNNQSVGIYTYFIVNSGNKEADDIGAYIDFGSDVISRLLINPNSQLIKITNFSTNKSVKLEIDRLNPQDTITITILANSQKPLPLHPSIEIRARGIPGKGQLLTLTSSEKSMIDVLLQILFPLIILIIIFLISSTYFARSKK